MHIFLRQIALSLGVLLTIVLLGGSYPTQAQSMLNLDQQPLILEKADIPVAAETRRFLEDRDDQVATVWLFFTDKGIFSESDFSARARSVVMSDKVLARRAKAGVTGTVFADLPVVNEYVETVINRGGKHRRTSRWLNAASFEIPWTSFDEIAALPFVAEVKPVVFFRRPEPMETVDVPEAMDSEDRDAVYIDYGSATGQVYQISVPAVHDQGYDGSGVTLAIFDTGYRKSHEAFAQAYADSRVLAEYDFIFDDANTANEGVDASTQWNHGTLIWSTSAGWMPGELVGPAYGANILLAKTEDVRSETSVEEDNWVAAVEWADSLGADVITSSLVYSDWYQYSDYDGQTAITTIAANMATAFGIVVCNAMGNAGPSSGTLGAPADAVEILSVGAVAGTGGIANFSSRGPTADGRIKPEVCARGVSTATASAEADDTYGYANGTSLSTPLVAGAACLLIQARPTFPPQLIRQALMETADNADTPDNTYGWGVINAAAALEWGTDFSADVTIADAPLTVQFLDESPIPATSRLWSFGDGSTSTELNPSHYYSEPGAYDVSLTIATDYGDITKIKRGYVIAMADTMTILPDSAFAGESVTIPVHLTNSMELERIVIPFFFGDTLDVTLDSTTSGNRTSYFESIKYLSQDPTYNRYTVELKADDGGGSPPLAPGSGEIASLYFTIDRMEIGGLVDEIDTTLVSSHGLSLQTEFASFTPRFSGGWLASKDVIRGDVNRSMQIDISDITYMVVYLFEGGDPPVTVQAGDLTADSSTNITDLTYLVDYLFNGGPPPVTP